MQKYLIVIILLAVFTAVSGCASPAAGEPPPLAARATPEPPTPDPDVPSVVGKLHWFGISSILYAGSKTIYFDPVMLEGELPPADIIIISHAHSDHADMESLKKILTSTTVLIISPNVGSFYNANAHEIGVVGAILKDGESMHIGAVAVQAVPAYDTVIHFRETGGQGFVVTVDGERIYFAGGTRFYPEMADIDSDVTIYPWYRNDDILQAANALNTKVLIPVHSGASGVIAFADVYGKKIANLKILYLEPGPYHP
jgi:L-ascorbate metabolism protein UlaG (beta-lactamase superfamily)